MAMRESDCKLQAHARGNPRKTSTNKTMQCEQKRACESESPSRSGPSHLSKSDKPRDGSKLCRRERIPGPDWSRSQGMEERPVVMPCRKIATTPPDRGRNARRGDQVRVCLHSTFDRCRSELGVVLGIGPLPSIQDPSNLHRFNARKRRRSSPWQVQDPMSAIGVHPIVFYNKFITPAIDTPSYPGARKFVWMRWPARYSARRKQ